MTTQEFHDIALSFPGTEDKPHFDRTAYKVIGKKIFATVQEESQSANLKLSLTEQPLFCAFDQKQIYPVPNKFGLQGWTTFELNQLPMELVKEALHSAYKNAMLGAKKK